MTAVQRHFLRRLARGGDSSEDLLPNAALAPTCEAIVDGFVRAIFSRAVLPATPHLLDMHDPAQNSPIVVTLRATLVGGQMWLDLQPLLVAEPKQIRAHRLDPDSVDQAFESKHG